MARPWWRKLLQPFLPAVQRARPHQPAAHPHSAQLDAQQLRQLIQGVFSTRPDELGCDDCYEQVDRFAEMVLSGKGAAEAMPLVQDHLNRCSDCREEFEALLNALQAIT